MTKHKHKKDVLFITHKYPPSTGGMQKQSYELISFAASKRNIHTIIFKGNYPKGLFFLIVGPLAWLKIIRNPNIGLVHFNDGLMALVLTHLLFFRKKVKLCATIHGLDIVFNASIYQYWVKKYLSKFSFLIAVSEATQRECVHAGIAVEKVHFIPNAVELPEHVAKDDLFKQWVLDSYNVNLNDHFIITSVGRPVPRKGFSWFANNILPNIENVKYLVVGTEMESSWAILTARKLLSKSLFERVCKMLGVPLDTMALSEIASRDNSNLLLMGKIPQNKLIQTYLHSDIFVMPNIHIKGDFEGFGLVALEAASLGAVCLASNIDGIPSAIKNGQNGYLMNSENTDEWIAKIKHLQQGDHLQVARDTFLTYFEKDQNSWSDMGEEYLQLFDQYLQV